MKEFTEHLEKYIEGFTSDDLALLIDIIYPRYKKESIARLLALKERPKYVIIETGMQNHTE